MPDPVFRGALLMLICLCSVPASCRAPLRNIDSHQPAPIGTGLYRYQQLSTK